MYFLILKLSIVWYHLTETFLSETAEYHFTVCCLFPSCGDHKFAVVGLTLVHGHRFMICKKMQLLLIRSENSTALASWSFSVIMIYDVQLLQLSFFPVEVCQTGACNLCAFFLYKCIKPVPVICMLLFFLG